MTMKLSGTYRASRRVSITDRSTGINFLIDTGADVSVFSVSAKEKMALLSALSKQQTKRRS